MGDEEKGPPGVVEMGRASQERIPRGGDFLTEF